MQLLTWILRVVVFLLLLSFATQNSELIALKYYLMDKPVELPLSIVLLVFFAMGVFLTYLSTLLSKYFKK
ncbi:MAG: LapA family protein [Pseudomonadota bacterium]